MDAISECEQILRNSGKKEEDAPWRIYFRKELFTPWHDPGYDEVATNLIFHQVCRGVRSEEYKMQSVGGDSAFDWWQQMKGGGSETAPADIDLLGVRW